MKRRDFLTNTALLGAGIPLGMSSAVMTSCTQQSQDAGSAAKNYSPEELGMFVAIAEPVLLPSFLNPGRMYLSSLWPTCFPTGWSLAGKC